VPPEHPYGRPHSILCLAEPLQDLPLSDPRWFHIDELPENTNPVQRRWIDGKIAPLIAKWEQGNAPIPQGIMAAATARRLGIFPE